MNTSVCARRHAGGFSMIELLITVVLAGIIFAAMVPVFAGALKKSSGDRLRLTATNIAQDRLEKIRQLPYAMISADATNTASTPNLYNPGFAGGQFATSYIPPATNKLYTIGYTVDTYPSYKKVTVRVDWSQSGPNYTTRMNTIVMDPSALSVSSTSNPFPAPPGGYRLTFSFKDWTHVISPGVVLKQVFTRPGTPTPVPTKTVTVTPAKMPASAATPTVTWTGLPGGPLINYTATCYSSHGGPYTTPVFHVLSNGSLKFDTWPGN